MSKLSISDRFWGLVVGICMLMAFALLRAAMKLHPSEYGRGLIYRALVELDKRGFDTGVNT